LPEPRGTGIGVLKGRSSFPAPALLYLAILHGSLAWSLINMIEFTSKPQKSFSPVILYIALGVAIILLGGMALYIHHQNSLKPSPGGPAIVVPGLMSKGNTNFEYYKNKIKIEDVKASLGISLSNARIASITGMLVNEGDRTLEAVQLHVTLYDMWGKVSKERTAFAFRPGSGFNYRPLKPLEKRTFTIGVESVEYYWNPKEISIEISGLKYE
jgi:hypothetical protein